MNWLDKLTARFKPVQAAIHRGDALLHEGDVAAAIDAYSTAIDHDPQSERAYFSRGAAYARIRNFPAALADYDAAIRINEKFAQAYYSRGLTLASLGEYQETVDDMTRALDAGLKEKYLAFGTRGSAFFALGDFDAAHADYMRAETVLVGWVYARAGLAICHHALGEIDAARELWSGLLASDERYRDLAWVQRQFDWPDALLAEAERLIAALG